MISKVVVLFAFVAIALGTHVAEAKREGRIVGGANVALTQVPSMASLRTLNNFHFCAGSILSNRWVLTAAQCTFGRVGNSINVVVGTVLLNSGGTTFRSHNITTHPLFDTRTLANDVSLIFTATVIGFNANIQTIALSPNIIAPSVSALISGWGSNSVVGGIAPNNLQRLTTTTISNAECRARNDPQIAKRIINSKICTFTTSGQGTCHGDEGGALIVGGLLVGISSSQVPCAQGHPDVYERISSSRMWILSIIS